MNTIVGDFDPNYQQLIFFVGYIFFLQVCLILVQVFLLFKYKLISKYFAEVNFVFSFFQINKNSKLFRVKEALLFCLKIIFKISFIGVLIVYFRNNKSDFIIVVMAVTMINLASLFQINFNTPQDEYINTITSNELNINSVFNIIKYKKFIFKTAPFILVFISSFIIIKEPYFKKNIWYLLIIGVFPFNHFIIMTPKLFTTSALLNFICSIVLFICFGIYVLKLNRINISSNKSKF